MDPNSAQDQNPQAATPEPAAPVQPTNPVASQSSDTATTGTVWENNTSAPAVEVQPAAPPAQPSVEPTEAITTPEQKATTPSQFFSTTTQAAGGTPPPPPDNQPTFASPPGEPDKPEPPKEHHSLVSKGFVIGVVVVLLFFSAAYAGIYYVLNSQVDKATSVGTTQPKPQQKTIVSQPTSAPVIANPTADWQTYNNPNPVFSLKYPKEATLDSSLATAAEPTVKISYTGPKQQNAANATLIDGYTFSVNWGPSVQSISASQAAQTALQGSKAVCSPDTKFSAITATSIAGQSGYTYTISNCNTVNYVISLVQNNGKIYKFTKMYNGVADDQTKYLDQLNKIEASVSFTQQQSQAAVPTNTASQVTPAQSSGTFTCQGVNTNPSQPTLESGYCGGVYCNDAKSKAECEIRDVVTVNNNTLASGPDGQVDCMWANNQCVPNK